MEAEIEVKIIFLWILFDHIMDGATGIAQMNKSGNPNSRASLAGMTQFRNWT